MIPMALDLTPLFAPILLIGGTLFLAAGAGLVASVLHDLTAGSRTAELSRPEPQPA